MYGILVVTWTPSIYPKCSHIYHTWIRHGNVDRYHFANIYQKKNRTISKASNFRALNFLRKPPQSWQPCFEDWDLCLKPCNVRGASGPVMDRKTQNMGGFHKWGYPKMTQKIGVFFRESPIDLDDKWGTPIIGKPLFCRINGHFMHCS